MGKKASITGATSGLGLSFAKKLASLGYDLIITGRRKEIIEKLADEMRTQYRVEVQVILAEMADGRDLQKVVTAIKNRDDLEFLINNAGFGINKFFWANDIEQEKDLVKVQVIASLELIHAVIPGMTKNGRGNIINVSSLAAFMPLVRNASYSGSKAFLNFFSESLHMELADKGIRVQSLCPGFIRTDFHKRVKMDPQEWERLQRFKWMEPEEVVQYSLTCLDKNRVICIPGFWNRMALRLISKIPRKRYYEFAGK
jgi:short-subunit dehydrogenase